MGLEVYMACRIADHVGIDIKKRKDVFKYTGTALGVLAGIVWGFVHVLRATFSLLSLIPVNLPLTFLAELITTNAFGIVFWILFECVREEKPPEVCESPCDPAEETYFTFQISVEFS